jgi:hypothetical protein
MLANIDFCVLKYMPFGKITRLDRTLWPTPRNFRLFESWFDISFHSIVADTCEVPLLSQEA